MRAEYAIRWDICQGGPRTAADTLTALGQPAGDPEDYEVQYFDITPPEDAPDGFKSILRQRQKGKKKHELTFKYRGDRELSASDWTCPFAKKPDEEKGEVDVSILAAGDSKRAYSYSCTLESKNEPVKPPKALKAQPKECTVKMSRRKADKLGLKIEEWHLPGNVVLVEVSRNGADTPAELESFQREVVAPLVEAGIKPSDRSKTEAGSSCQQ
jgi:hypothetical protein